MKKRILSIILTLVMVVLLLPQNSLPVNAAGTTLSVGSFADLKVAITNTATDGDIIEITAPITIPETLVVTKNLTFTASGTGKLTRDSGFIEGSIFWIKASGKTVTFQNITIDGNNVMASWPGIIIENGELIFQNGAVLQNCKDSRAFGGGIEISASGKFTMNGGTIQDNYSVHGGGVQVIDHGSFTMTGGRIINNNVNDTGLGGGIQIGQYCSVKISGDAQIYGNTKENGRPDNIYLEYNTTLELTGALTNTTPIGVGMQGAGMFTSGEAVTNTDYISKFVSDSSDCTVQAEGNQLKLLQNTYLVTISVNRDDVAWTGHGKSFKLVKSGADYTNLTAIPSGNYDIYEGTTDTGVDVTVNGAAASATVDYYTVTLAAGEGIASTSGTGTYRKGSSPIINATVDPNYSWNKWTQSTGGAEVSTTNSYTITNIQSAKSYTATAAKILPNIGNIPDQSPILTGSDPNAGLTKPVVSAGAYTIASQGWQCSADGNTNWYNIPVGSTCSAAQNGNYLRYYATYDDSGTKIVYSPNTKQMTVNRYTPTLTLEVTPASPQVSGTTIRLKASISGGIYMTNQGYLNTVPVIFKAGTTTIGTANISATTGVATFETTTLAVGDHNFTAVFPGDSDFNASAASNVVNYTITSPPAPAGPAPAGSTQTTETSKETKTITVVEVPQSIPDNQLLTVEPVGEAFDKSVEVRLKEDTIAESMVRRAIETASSDLNMDNAVIIPFDISIYLKGSDTKVQPKEGTSVLITCPIPKQLLIDKDKLVVLCVINEKLQVLPVTLITKNGVPCAQFTATHFSPYAFVIDKDNKLKDYASGTSPDVVTNISTKLTATAGTVTKVNLEGIKEGSTITYHVCTPTLISIDSNGNLFTKKAGNAILMAEVTNNGTRTVYTIHIKVKNAKGGTKVGFIQYYDNIIVFNNVNYRITAEASTTKAGTVAVANNQINTNLPKQVVIPEIITYKGKTYKVASIDESAFYNMNNITSVTIPYSVKDISPTAFVSCDSLKTFQVASENKYYSAKKGMLLNKEGTTLIAYPSAKGTIAIDKKVTVIGTYAFSVCKYLTGVVIPKTVTRIEGCAFAHSKSLTKVTFQSMTVPNISYLCIFEEVNKACTIFVPETSLLKYQDALKNSRMPKGISVSGKK